MTSSGHANLTREVQQLLQDVLTFTPLSELSASTIESTIKTVIDFRNESYSKDISRMTDLIERQNAKDQPTKEQIQQILQEIARVQALDISEEISLLLEIKDVQDELGIMAMVFEDQKRVLVAMDNTVLPLMSRTRTSTAPFLSPIPRPGRVSKPQRTGQPGPLPNQALVESEVTARFKASNNSNDKPTWESSWMDLAQDRKVEEGTDALKNSGPEKIRQELQDLREEQKLVVEQSDMRQNVMNVCHWLRHPRNSLDGGRPPANIVDE